MSIVATGGLSVKAVPFCFLVEAFESSGANADASTEEMSLSAQFAVMLSGNRYGSSTIKTSESLRRPRCFALA